MKIIEAERAVNYTFKDKKLLTRALTLASADTENNNQLLEFFGDAILEFIVSERIFGEGESEGALTERRKNIVSDKALAPVSKKLGRLLPQSISTAVWTRRKASFFPHSIFQKNKNS